MTRQALVIGINRYPFLQQPPLKAPYRDATSIAKLLDRAQENPDLAWCVESLSGKENKRVVKAEQLHDKIYNLFLPNTQTPPELEHHPLPRLLHRTPNGT